MWKWDKISIQIEIAVRTGKITRVFEATGRWLPKPKEPTMCTYRREAPTVMFTLALTLVKPHFTQLFEKLDFCDLNWAIKDLCGSANNRRFWLSFVIEMITGESSAYFEFTSWNSGCQNKFLENKMLRSEPNYIYGQNKRWVRRIKMKGWASHWEADLIGTQDSSLNNWTVPLEQVKIRKNQISEIELLRQILISEMKKSTGRWICKQWAAFDLHENHLQPWVDSAGTERPAILESRVGVPAGRPRQGTARRAAK